MQRITYRKSISSKKRIVIQSKRRTMFGLLTFGVSGALFAGCQSKPKLQCAGKNQLSISENMARKGRQYVEVSKRSKENCTNCALFRPAGLAEPACGVCGVDGLPANPQGYCVSWAPVST